MPDLMKAVFYSHTNDDDKDHDTGVYVELRTQDGSSILAHANNRDNSGDDGSQYKDGSDHSFDLDLDAPGIDRNACNGFRVKVWQHTNGKDTWKFNARVVLFFTDRSNLAASKDGIVLTNDSASDNFNAQ